MSSTLIKFRISETERNLRNATDSQEIAQLEKDLKELETPFARRSK